MEDYFKPITIMKMDAKNDKDDENDKNIKVVDDDINKDKLVGHVYRSCDTLFILSPVTTLLNSITSLIHSSIKIINLKLVFLMVTIQFLFF